MNFFQHQAQAKKKTLRLVILFVITVAAIIAACYFVALLGFYFFEFQRTAKRLAAPQPFPWWSWDIFYWTAAAVLSVVLVGSLWKIHSLSGGGVVVATQLGGKYVPPDTRDPDERKLRNVVEEIAIASGTAVPEVFVLDQEEGINAFAAGNSPDDAAVAVTRGCIKHLSRDELQGVIAHEFSHICNGDMRLNIRLIGLIHGILVIGLIGQNVLRGIAEGSRVRTSRKSGGGILLLALLGGLIMLIGYIGVFFGRVIKAAVSRQREFLADATAVAFTRNPDGLAMALKKIGGHSRRSAVMAPAAEQASHMFFASGFDGSVFFESLLATHPPLVERIRRIDPSFDGVFPKLTSSRAAPRPTTARPVGVERALGLAGGATLRIDPDEIVSQVAAPTIDHLVYGAALIAAVPDPLRDAARDARGAVGVVYALLLSTDPDERGRQLSLLAARPDSLFHQEVPDLSAWVAGLDAALRLPLLDLAVPALRALNAGQRQALLEDVRQLVVSDRLVSVFEFALMKVLTIRLAPAAEHARRQSIQYRAITGVLPQCQVLLSALARAGTRDSAAARRAFEAGWRKLGRTPVPAAGGTGGTGLLTGTASGLNAVDQALDKLARAAPIVKERVLDACARCVLADGSVTVKEAELLRAVADALGCPLPPFLPRATESAP